MSVPTSSKAHASSPRPLLLFPCNGNAIEALSCLDRAFECVGFIDDAKQGTQCHGLPVMGRDALARWPHAMVLAVPGSSESFRSRRALIDGLDVDPQRWATVIHPAAHVSPLARVGRNVLLMAGVVVTSNAVIEDDVCVLPNSVIHHDAQVGRGVLIGSCVTVAGSVVLADHCYVASGTSLKHGVRVGSGALVGLGSTVIRDVAPGRVVAGNPSRELW